MPYNRCKVKVQYSTNVTRRKEKAKKVSFELLLHDFEPISEWRLSHACLYVNLAIVMLKKGTALSALCRT